MGGKGSKAKPTKEMAAIPIDPDKPLRPQIRRKKRAASLSSKPTPPTLQSRNYTVPEDESPHVAAKVVLEILNDAFSRLNDCQESLEASSKVPEDVAVLRHDLHCLETLLVTVRSALRPLMSDPLARVDKEVTVQLMIIVDELQEGRVEIDDARIPDSAFSFSYVGYVATYFAGCSVAEAAERIRNQTEGLCRQWTQSFRRMIGRMEKTLSDHDERLAYLEEYSTLHDVPYPKEYFDLVDLYDAGTQDLLTAISNNTTGISKYKKRKERKINTSAISRKRTLSL